MHGHVNVKFVLILSYLIINTIYDYFCYWRYMNFGPKSKHLMATQVNTQITHVIHTVWGTAHECCNKQRIKQIRVHLRDK